MGNLENTITNFKKGLQNNPQHQDNLPSGEKFFSIFKYDEERIGHYLDNSQLFKVIGEWREDEDGKHFKYGEKLINFDDNPIVKYWADDARDFAIFTNPLRVKVYDLETENEDLKIMVKKKLSEGTKMLSDRSLEK